MSFLESLGGHKDLKHPPVHHYHMHYYPVPLIGPPPKPALHQKIEIDLSTIRQLHHDDHHYYQQHQPPPQLHSGFGSEHLGLDVLPPSDPEPGPWISPELGWPDSSIQSKSASAPAWAWDNNDLLEKNRAYKEAKSSGILLQVPLHQQIVFYQPPTKDNKWNLLTLVLKKLRRVNNALFHPENDEHEHEHHHDRADTDAADGNRL